MAGLIRVITSEVEPQCRFSCHADFWKTPSGAKIRNRDWGACPQYGIWGHAPPNKNYWGGARSINYLTIEIFLTYSPSKHRGNPLLGISGPKKL